MYAIRSYYELKSINYEKSIFYYGVNRTISYRNNFVQHTLYEVIRDVYLRRSETKRVGRFSDAFRFLWVILSKFWDGWERVCHAMKPRTRTTGRPSSAWPWSRDAAAAISSAIASSRNNFVQHTLYEVIRDVYIVGMQIVAPVLPVDTDISVDEVGIGRLGESIEQ